MWTTTPSDRSRARRGPRRRARRAARALAAIALVLAPAIARADDAPPATAPTAAPDAPDGRSIESLRERFREGMDKYKAGAFADASVIWEAIYRELGADKGYRLAFDLARAYDALADLVRAADHYESYLFKVNQRRSAGEALEANVERQEQTARDRLVEIATAKGRVLVKATGGRPVIASVDAAPARVAPFTVYVEPGPHSVTLGAGKDAERRAVTVRRGEIIYIEPREIEPAPPAPQPQWQPRLERPFAPAVIWIGAGIAAASLVIPALTYSSALSIKSEYESQPPSTPESEKKALENDYESARSNAYASVAVPVVLTAAVGGLAIWYVLGAKERRVPVPTAAISSTGAAAGLSARF